MSNFSNGFVGELIKLSSDASDAFSATGRFTENIGEISKEHRGKLSALSAVTGIPVGALVGLLMGGKGRRLRGMGIGALVGGGAGAVRGATTPEALSRGGRRLAEAAEKTGAMKHVKKELDKGIKESTIANALAGGSLAALIAALASKKGLRLKRALAGGVAGGAAGGLTGLGATSKAHKDLLDIATDSL